MKYEGMFHQGLAHGRGTRSFADVNQLGKFEDGELQGNAIVIDLTLGRMEGQFNRSIPHGHIDSTTTQIKGSFDGYFLDGLRTGFGRLDFGNVDRDEKMKQQTLEKVRWFDTARFLFRVAISVILQRKSLHGMSHKIRTEQRMETSHAPEVKASEDHEVELSGSSDDESSKKAAQPFSQQEYEDQRQRKLRRKRKRRAKRQASFNRFVRGGGGASSDALVGGGAGQQSDESNSSSDEDVYGRSKGQVSKYDKYDDYNMPYRGDYGYEGWLRANKVWNGGVFVARKGKPVHHAHYRYFAHRLKNVSLPIELSVLAGLEQRVLDGRIKIQRNTVAEAVSRRLTQESSNLLSYRYWRKIAKLNMAHYRTRNQQLQRGIRELKDSLIGDKSAAAWEKAAGTKNKQTEPSEDFIQTQDDTVELYQAQEHGDVEEEEASSDEEDFPAAGADAGFAHAAYGDDVNADTEYAGGL